MTTAAGPNSESEGVIIAYDPASLSSYSPNVHPRSLDVFGWAELSGAGFRAISSRDNIYSPVGNTPMKVIPTIDGSGGYTLTYNAPIDNLAPAVQGETWTFSFWAKANKNINGGSFVFEANSAGQYIQAPNKAHAITTEWQRFEHTYTFINPLSAFIQVRVDWVGDTTAIYWFDGFQVEKSSAATKFNASNIEEASILQDLSGNNYNLPLVSSDVFSTDSGGCIEFTSGTTGRAQLDMYGANGPLVGSKDANNWDGTSTHEIWFNPSVLDETVRFLFSDGNSNEGTIDITSTRVRCFFGGSNTITYNTVLSTGTWYHAAMVHHKDDAADLYRLSFYFNGELIETTSDVISTAPSFYGPDSYMRIGQLFTGKLGPIKVYNTNLTAAEIKRNFESQRRRFGV